MNVLIIIIIGAVLIGLILYHFLQNPMVKYDCLEMSDMAAQGMVEALAIGIIIIIVSVYSCDQIKKDSTGRESKNEYKFEQDYKEIK